MEGGGQLASSVYFISSVSFPSAFDVCGLGFEFCVYVAGWRGMVFGVGGLLLFRLRTAQAQEKVESGP